MNSRMTPLSSFHTILSRSRRFRVSEIAVALLLLCFFIVLLLWPIWQIVSAGFHRRSGEFTFDYFLLIFHDPVLVRGLFNAAGVAVAVTSVCFSFRFLLRFSAFDMNFQVENS